MFREERIRNIMEIIKSDKNVYVRTLAKKFNRSESSIRLDLAELEKRGLIIRTHGGAMLVDSAVDNFELRKSILSTRNTMLHEEKKRIGKATADLIHDGDSILIDGGSTTNHVAKNLSHINNLTIITTSTHLFNYLVEMPNIKIYLTGGFYFREYEELTGEIALDSLSRFKPDHTILGIDGISIEHGLTSLEPTIAPIKRRMISLSKDIIIASDHTKLGKSCLFPVADLNEIHKIVTDSGADPEYVEKLNNAGIEVITA